MNAITPHLSIKGKCFLVREIPYFLNDDLNIVQYETESS